MELGVMCSYFYHYRSWRTDGPFRNDEAKAIKDYITAGCAGKCKGSALKAQYFIGFRVAQDYPEGYLTTSADIVEGDPYI